MSGLGATCAAQAPHPRAPGHARQARAAAHPSPPRRQRRHHRHSAHAGGCESHRHGECRGRKHPPPGGPGGYDAPFGYYNGPEIGVSIAPRTEHWFSNYWPDGYSLDDYDGPATPPRICRGQTGTTISTIGGACPKGQRADPGSREWSTGPGGAR